MVCVALSKWKSELGILTGDQASEHENSVVDVRDSADLVPPAGNDARDIEAEEEGEQARQRHRSIAPLRIFLLCPLSATLRVIVRVASRQKPEKRFAVWRTCVVFTARRVRPLALILVPDPVGAEEALVVLVVPLQHIVEDKEDEREPEHPLDGELERSQLARIEPGRPSSPRALFHLSSLGQD